MVKVIRYDLTYISNEMTLRPFEYGDYVTHDDYAILEAINTQLKEEIERLRMQLHK